MSLLLGMSVLLGRRKLMNNNPEKRILIVEDDAVLLRGLSDSLRNVGYQVETASDGRAGLNQALNQSPDLMLLDIMLPLLNGFELCQRVRQAKLNFPIIMLTAKGDEEDVVRGLELGADDYVPKPFGIRELQARIKRLLRTETKENESKATFGECLLDRESRQLFRDDVEIVLTNKEYRLLEMFVSRPNRALTRRDIMEQVWGSSIIVTGRSVDRCVATLRQKIEETPSQPKWIQTIRDVGYRFVV